MPLNYLQSGYFLALYNLIQLVLNLGRADFSRNQKTHDMRTRCSMNLLSKIWEACHVGP